MQWGHFLLGGAVFGALFFVMGFVIGSLGAQVRRESILKQILGHDDRLEGDGSYVIHMCLSRGSDSDDGDGEDHPFPIRDIPLRN